MGYNPTSVGNDFAGLRLGQLHLIGRLKFLGQAEGLGAIRRGASAGQ
jgi:hypothetical protein